MAKTGVQKSQAQYDKDYANWLDNWRKDDSNTANYPRKEDYDVPADYVPKTALAQYMKEWMPAYKYGRPVPEDHIKQIHDDLESNYDLPLAKSPVANPGGNAPLTDNTYPQKYANMYLPKNQQSVTTPVGKAQKPALNTKNPYYTPNYGDQSYDDSLNGNNTSNVPQIPQQPSATDNITGDPNLSFTNSNPYYGTGTGLSNNMAPVGAGIGQGMGAGVNTSPQGNMVDKLFPNGVQPNDVYDLARLGIGLNGALKKVPAYSRTGAWSNYVNRARRMSQQGFTPEEYSLANNNANNAYASDIQNVNNAAGGNASVVLGNLGRATGSLYNAKAVLAARNAELQRQNFQQYGNVLGQDNHIDRQIFEDRANQVMESKRAGAQLANDAIYNLKNRGEYEKTYGKSSLYNRYMEGLADKQDLENQNLKSSQQAFAKQKPGNVYLPVSGTTGPNIGKAYNVNPDIDPSVYPYTMKPDFSDYINSR